MIKINNLTRMYEGKNNKKFTALNNINLEIEKGKITCLLGQNGAGKTTLIKCLSTLLVPSEGNIEIEGEDLYSNIKKFRIQISYLFGGERGLYNRLSGRDNVEYFLALKGIFDNKSKKTTEEYFEKFGIIDFIDVPVENYSRGMKQKVHLINAIISDSKIILLDEPTTGMDPLSAKQIRDFIRAYSREKNKYIFFTSHIMSEVEEMSDNVILLNKGVINYKGSIQEFKKELNDEVRCFVKINKSESILSEISKNKMIKSYEVNDNNIEMVVNGKSTEEIIDKVISQYKNIIISSEFKNITLEDVYIDYLRKINEVKK